MTPAAAPAPPGIDLTRTALGIEFGSTRIKAVLTDPSGAVLASGGHTWDNRLVDGVWTYSIDEVETGLRATRGVELTTVGAIGVSGMMHGYLPLDDRGRPLTAFRTWRNTITAESSAALSALFGLNIPQRWSISHLHRAVTGSEEHVEGIARITTLAGYVHWRLIGRHVLGVGEASGVFPIGASGRSFDTDMIAAFDGAVTAPWSLADILPEVAVAGREAGRLTESGAALLDPTGTLEPGIPLCPPEGDAGTGMVATDSVRPRTGNVSAGTSAQGDMDEAGVISHNFLSGDALVHLPAGRPLTMRRPGAALTLAGLMRSHLFSLFASMAHGIRVLRRCADVPIDSMSAHGSVFATPEIPQRTLAAAFDTPLSVAATASQGGAWGMSLLAGYLLWGRGRALEDYLDREIFADARSVTITATAEEVAEYGRYLERFIAALPVQATAVEVF